MKQLFLTSSVDSVAAHIATQLDMAKYRRLAFITTPVEPEIGDLSWLADDRAALESAGFSVTDYTITGKTAVQLQSDLTAYDTIYVSGGNTYYMLQQSQQTGFIDVIRELVNVQGKVYISTSAGSIIAGPDTEPALRLEKLEDAPLLNGFLGFNLVNFCILPHWGSRTFRNLYLETRLEHAYKKGQVPLVLLTDTQYVKVVDEMVQFIEVGS